MTKTKKIVKPKYAKATIPKFRIGDVVAKLSWDGIRCYMVERIWWYSLGNCWKYICDKGNSFTEEECFTICEAIEKYNNQIKND